VLAQGDFDHFELDAIERGSELLAARLKTAVERRRLCRPRAGDLGREHARLEHGPRLGERDDPPDLVVELPDVARPGKQQQLLHRVLGDPHVPLAIVGSGAREEVMHERRDLVAALAQGRDLQPDDVEAIEEIFAKPPGLDGQLEVRVGGDDDTDVHGEWRAVAERTDFARLEEAQQFGLQFEAELADLVEEERAAARRADDAGTVAVGAGERAAPVAEQLALQHLAGDGGAVEGDERSVGAIGVVVDGSRDDFLAGPAFSGNEDADVGRRDPFGESHDARHAAGDNGVSVLERRLVDRPEGETLFAFGAPALDVVDGGEEQRDGVHGGDGFDVAVRLDPQFGGAIAYRSDDEAARPGGFGRLVTAGRRGEDLGFARGVDEDGGGAADAAGPAEQFDELVGEKLRPAGLDHERGYRLEDGVGGRFAARGGSRSRVFVWGGLDGGVPAARELEESRDVAEGGVEALGAPAVSVGARAVAGGGEGAGEDCFVLGVEIRRLRDEIDGRCTQQGERFASSIGLLQEESLRQQTTL